MNEIRNTKSYKSPRRKLVKFFERSRDQWKAKCLEAKTQLKRQSNRTRFLAKSKEQWKSRVKELEEELGRIREAERGRQAQGEEKKKS